jgi:hypothetical protein
MVEESSSQLSDHRKSVERWRDAEPGNTRTDGSSHINQESKTHLPMYHIPFVQRLNSCTDTRYLRVLMLSWSIGLLEGKRVSIVYRRCLL